ncbi:MAG: baseplate J/gp47 family protein [Clostridiales Family XIII bacterium]|nr:baseplate J/gp47 family protein [Clostridiales Family XIII bacterium]
MIDSINLADKTYEEILAEAIERIPMYTDEWTNFNVSDPGITILQNLSMFTALLREKINDVPEAVRFGLLGMLGFSPGAYRASEVFIGADGLDGSLSFPLGEKFMAEDICFEADGEVRLDAWGVKGLYCENDEGLRDITYLQGGASRSGVAVFGAPAEVGARFYVLFDDIPKDRENLILIVRVTGDENRNAFGDADPAFAELRWQFFAKDGWTDAEAVDETRGLLKDGIVKLSIDASQKARCAIGREEGYALRCVLRSGRYDISPRIHAITANVFKACQKDSKVTTRSLPGRGSVLYRDRVGMNGYCTVFCDEDGSGAYRKYTPFDGRKAVGRFYEERRTAEGIDIRFDAARFGFGPDAREDAVRVVGCDAAVAEHLVLGRLMGYDDQTLRVEGFDHILADDFCVLAEGRDEDGTGVYFFVRPDEEDEGKFRYRVSSDVSELRVCDPGNMDGFLLHLASCSVTEGARGNVRAGTSFVPKFLSAERERAVPSIENALPSGGGTTRESAEQLRLRFLADLWSPTVAVTIGDYEHIVKSAPGLCIHKVKAVAALGRNLVRIAVKPYGEEDMPSLSPLYADIILRHLEQRRMIGTKVELIPPVYTAVDVHAVVYVKNYYENAKEIVESYLRDELDGVSGSLPFGTRISYNSIYKGLEALECVETLFEFAIAPRDRLSARLEGPDIVFRDDTLCYPGELRLEIR